MQKCFDQRSLRRLEEMMLLVVGMSKYFPGRLTVYKRYHFLFAVFGVKTEKRRANNEII